MDYAQLHVVINGSLEGVSQRGFSFTEGCRTGPVIHLGSGLWTPDIFDKRAL